VISLDEAAAAAQVRLIVWCEACQHQVEPEPKSQRYWRLCSIVATRPALFEVAENVYRRAPCQLLGEPGFRHFSTLPGGQLSVLVFRLLASGGD
jgi:hypothetical protein